MKPPASGVSCTSTTRTLCPALALKISESHSVNMQQQIHELIPVNGNRYFTPYGFYACTVTVADVRANTVEVKVTLVNERDGSQPARVYRITGSLPEIARQRLSLVMEIHKWAQLHRSEATYWVSRDEI